MSMPAFEFDEEQVKAAAVVVAEITGEPRPGRFERTMARAILQAAADIDVPDREICPQPCEHLSQHDAREGRTCAEHPCTCTDREVGSSDA